MPTDQQLISVLLCIDVEPDPRRVDPEARVDWAGFENAFVLIERLRPAMVEATGRPARLSWFLRLDPQIAHVYGDAGWAVTRYREHFDVLQAAGDEFGIHLHPWQWDRARSVWIQDFADQSWVTHCVESAFAAYEKAFNATCRAFRFGDRWMNDETMALIERLGATSDSTIEPGRVGTETPDTYYGTFPDYSDVPNYPYRPSRHDFKVPSPDPVNVLVLPVTSAPAAWASTAPVGYGAADHADFEGTLDVASMIEIAGWVWDRNNPSRLIDVAITCDGEPLATVGASRHRDDLSAAGKGDGVHAFRLATPRRIQDGKPHRISAHVVGTNFELVGGPRILQGTPEPDSENVTLYLDHHPFTFGLLVDRILVERAPALLTLKVRSDFGSSLQRSSNVRLNIEHLLHHPLANRFDFITSSEFVRTNDAALRVH